MACLPLRLIGGWRRSKRRVVVLEPYGMGDILALQPLIGLLCRKGLPVTVCAREPWRPLIPADWNVGWIPARVPWSGYSIGSKYGNVAAMCAALLRQIRALRTAAVGGIGIDPRGDVRSIFLLWASGCRRVISFDAYVGSDLGVLPGIAERVPPPTGLRRWELNLLLASGLGCARPEGGVPPSLKHLCVAARPVAGRVGLIPVAPWAGKEWIPERWREVAGFLAAKGFHPVALHGPGQEEAARDCMGPEVPRVMCASVEEWARRLAELEAVVTVDTGPMHMAGALGLSTVALVGSSVLPLWAPGGPATRVLQHQDETPCAPCHQVGACPYGKCRAMALITVEEVCRNLQAVLGDRQFRLT
jgi:ADP-heptose:LPS heptosyltransferase